MEEIRENIKNVQEKIKKAAEKAGRNPDDIKLVAVTKGVGIEKIKEAALFGQRIFGESFFQEARDKIKNLSSEENEISWHFIGHLQTNKAKYIARYFDYLHTLDSLALAHELNKHLQKIKKTLPVLIQINLGREPQKHGILPEQAESFINSIKQMSNLDLRGFMTIHPNCDDPNDSIKWFKELRELRDKLSLAANIQMNELSMGMSSDFEQAIIEGATFVRIGTQIFGKRARKKEK